MFKVQVTDFNTENVNLQAQQSLHDRAENCYFSNETGWDRIFLNEKSSKADTLTNGT